MMKTCLHEKEVGDLAARGQWPLAAGPELRDHVSACRVCTDLVLVAGAFQRMRAEMIAEAKLASPGVLWWRAQLRRRRAAVERIEKPLVRAQIFALAVGLLSALGFAGFEARHGVAWLDWLEGLPQSTSLHLADFSSSGLLDSGWFWLLFASATATLALLAGAAIYLAGEKR